MRILIERPQTRDTLPSSLTGTVVESVPTSEDSPADIVLPSAKVQADAPISAPLDLPIEVQLSNSISEIPTTSAASESELPTESTAPMTDQGEQAYAIIDIDSDVADEKKILLMLDQEMTFGSSELADVVLSDHSSVSPLHVSVKMQKNGCEIRDMGSATGISVDGRPVTFANLTSSSDIIVGDSLLRITVFGFSQTEQTAKEPVAGANVAIEPTVSRVIRRDRMTGGVPNSDQRPFRDGLEHQDLSVFRSALHAAAWTRQPWLLDYCRGIAAGPDLDRWEAVRLFALLGEPSDLDIVIQILRNPRNKAARFEIARLFGHWAVIEDLIVTMESNQPHDVVRAAEAFSGITGINIDSSERVALLPEDGSEPDEFEQEFLDRVFLPDLPKAKQFWNQQQASYKKGTRWCCGNNASAGSTSFRVSLDLRSRWEVTLRDHYHGYSTEAFVELLRFQCPFSG
ncbi:MAG: FHA domain-containing protein [Pirellulaceae bacterium]